MLSVESIARTFASVAVYGLLLFVPAWTLDWWRGWMLLALIFAGMIITRLWAFRDKESLLEERRKPPLQDGQPVADKMLVVGFLVVFPAYIAFIPLDVFRFHLFGKPAPIVSLLGLILCVTGWFTISLAFRENAFAAAIVKHQKERLQMVVETGVYSVVRHPLYSGVILVLVGVALWLQSYAAAVGAIIPIALIGLRVFVEERHLGRQLPGYDAYMKRVEHRIVPLIW